MSAEVLIWDYCDGPDALQLRLQEMTLLQLPM